MTLKVQSKASKPMKQYTRKHDTALKAVSSSVGEAGLNYWRVYSRRQALRRVLHSKIQAVQQTLRFERKTREMRDQHESSHVDQQQERELHPRSGDVRVCEPV